MDTGSRRVRQQLRVDVGGGVGAGARARAHDASASASTGVRRTGTGGTGQVMPLVVRKKGPASASVIAGPLGHHQMHIEMEMETRRHMHTQVGPLDLFSSKA